MIKIVKGQKPSILVKKATVWRDKFLVAQASGSVTLEYTKSKYRHSEIKSALKKETHEKCVYCESKMLHVHHGDVEHINPKSIKPELTFEWENLTFSCEICNQNKSNFDPYLEHIIDPYAVDPRDHIVFYGSFATHLTETLGRNTIEIIKINRNELVERRSERVRYIIKIFESIVSTNTPLAAKRALYYDLIHVECAPQAEYSAMVRDAISVLSERVPSEVICT